MPLKLRGHLTVAVASAITSRLATLVLMIVANQVIPTHNATGVHVFHPTQFPVPSRPGVGGILAPFTRWDSAWFLSIAHAGYPVPRTKLHEPSMGTVDCTGTEKSWGGLDYSMQAENWSELSEDERCREDVSLEEQAHAFFPLYPWVVRVFGNSLSKTFWELDEAQCIIFAALLVSNVSFVAAVVFLYYLGVVMTRDSLLALGGALAFCATPASVFFSTAYSESLYAAFTFGGLLVLFSDLRSGRDKFTNSPTDDIENRQMRRRRGWLGTLQAWIAALLLAAATLTRSNGIVTIGVLLLEKLRWLADEAGVLSAGPQRRAETSSAVAASPDLAQVRSNAPVNDGWRKAALGCRLAAGAIMSALQATLVFSPYALVQLYAYQKFCDGHLNHGSDLGLERLPSAGMEGLRHPWCAWRVPSLYAYVQSTYWGNGFLAYYQWKQVPNFLLAAPALALTACGTTRFFFAQFEGRAERVGGNHVRAGELDASLGEGSAVVESRRCLLGAAKRLAEVFLGPKTLPHPASKPFERSGTAALVVHWTLLGSFAAVCMNAQVATRFLAAACPPLHWWTASLLLPGTVGRSTASSPVVQRALLLYIASFFVLGAVLHANFLPWT